MNLLRLFTAVAAFLLLLSSLWAGELGRAMPEYLVSFILPVTRPGGPQVECGRYLVTLGVCHDSHTPQGPDGRPRLDRLLSGHPEGLAPAPAVQDAFSMTPTLTSFSGPWGTSFTRNLTPDEKTGTGK